MFLEISSILVFPIPLSLSLHLCLDALSDVLTLKPTSRWCDDMGRGGLLFGFLKDAVWHFSRDVQFEVHVGDVMCCSTVLQKCPCPSSIWFLFFCFVFYFREPNLFLGFFFFIVFIFIFFKEIRRVSRLSMVYCSTRDVTVTSQKSVIFFVVVVGPPRSLACLCCLFLHRCLALHTHHGVCIWCTEELFPKCDWGTVSLYGVHGFKRRSKTLRFVFVSPSSSL